MTKGRRAALTIDIVVESGLWRKVPRVRAAAGRAVTEAAAMLSTRPTEVAIVLTNDSQVRSLNRLWRGIDAATNVLSFPSSTTPGEPAHLGDIVLAYQTIAREAADEHKPMADHVAHLAVHGYLHLLGYDHDNDTDAEAMEQAERRILRRLSVPDPYRVAVRGATKTAPKRAANIRSKARTLPRIPLSR